MPLRAFALAMAVTALCPPLTAQAAPKLAKPSPEAARGAALFAQLGCSACHGTVGQGGAGPRLAPQPRPPAYVTAYVRSPAGDMPPFTQKLASDADMAAIYAWLAAIPQPTGGPGKP